MPKVIIIQPCPIYDVVHTCMYIQLMAPTNIHVLAHNLSAQVASYNTRAVVQNHRRI